MEKFNICVPVENANEYIISKNKISCKTNQIIDTILLTNEEVETLDNLESEICQRVDNKRPVEDLKEQRHKFLNHKVEEANTIRKSPDYKSIIEWWTKRTLEGWSMDHGWAKRVTEIHEITNNKINEYIYGTFDLLTELEKSEKNKK